MGAPKKPKLRRIFSQLWLFEPIQDRADFRTKPMFGGLAVYLDTSMVCVLMESPGDREWKGKTYPFSIWNGLLFPTDRCHHKSLMQQFNALTPHPVLAKWVYLPLESDDYESVAPELITLIGKHDARFGILAGAKKKAKKKAVKKRLTTPVRRKSQARKV